MFGRVVLPIIRVFNTTNNITTTAKGCNSSIYSSSSSSSSSSNIAFIQYYVHGGFTRFNIT